MTLKRTILRALKRLANRILYGKARASLDWPAFDTRDMRFMLKGQNDDK